MQTIILHVERAEIQGKGHPDFIAYTADKKIRRGFKGIRYETAEKAILRWTRSKRFRGAKVVLRHKTNYMETLDLIEGRV